MSEELIRRNEAITKFAKEGVSLERRGVTQLTMVEVKQWAVDLLEDIPSVSTDGDMIYIEDLGAVYDEIEKEWNEKFEELCAGDYMISPGYILGIMEDVRKRTWRIPTADTTTNCTTNCTTVNKTGEWVRFKNAVGEDVTICSNCGTAMRQAESNYCAFCGADMRGEDNE